jgi:hypothetical protein
MGDTRDNAEVEVEVAEAAEVTLEGEVTSEEAVDTTAEDSSVAQETVVEEAKAEATPEDDDDDEVYNYPKEYANNIFGKCHKALDKGWEWVKEKLHLPTLTRKQKAAIWDKITTGILIFLFCTPILILIYILLWFVLK